MKFSNSDIIQSVKLSHFIRMCNHEQHYILGIPQIHIAKAISLYTLNPAVER